MTRRATRFGQRRTSTAPATQWLRRWGQGALAWTASLGRASILWWRAFFSLPRRGDAGVFVRQIYDLGVRSLPIIVLSAVSVGAVLSLQFHAQLARFGAEDVVGGGVALVLLRELGPVLTALLFAGGAGSAITAEIGLMKTTEQLASLEMMGVDPLRRVVAPRLWAGLLCVPALTAIFSMVAILAGTVAAVDWLGIDRGAYWTGMNEMVELRNDVAKGALKSVVFAMLVTWIAVFQGYDAYPSAQGIGRATTRTVVLSSVMVLALDFLLTLRLYGVYGA